MILDGENFSYDRHFRAMNLLVYKYLDGFFYDQIFANTSNVKMFEIKSPITRKSFSTIKAYAPSVLHHMRIELQPFVKKIIHEHNDIDINVDMNDYAYRAFRMNINDVEFYVIFVKKDL